jgi:hypothetical protein
LRRLKALAALSGEAATSDISAIGDFVDLPSTMFDEAKDILGAAP